MEKQQAENKNDHQIQKNEKILELSGKIVQLARDHILMHMRFLDVALSRLKPCPAPGTGCFQCDGQKFIYDPVLVIRSYRKETGSVIRAYLHVLFHMIFFHGFQYDKVDQELWDLACDMAAEHTVMELSLPGTECGKDLQKQEILSALKQEGVSLTAEKLYRYYQKNPLDFDDRMEYARLFHVDEHGIWNKAEQMSISLAQWKKLTERLKADLKSFSRGKNHTESLSENLEEATRERVDYTEFLKRFVVSGEAVHVNDDEFDYIYYHYGLEQYGNMPLIEPLEYKDVEKVHDFVIAIDTSASCRGKIVRAFLNKTYSIMKTADAFFEDMNVHIIQCDHEVQSDALIRNQEDFDAYLAEQELKGFGSTDFRPVFEHVDRLISQGAFTNLKGLIYFTDGYGSFPERMPDYDTVFVFLHEDDKHPPIPSWAVKIVLDGELEDEY